jgi:hypothetical protein
VIEEVETGASRREAAERYGLSPSVVVIWVQRFAACSAVGEINDDASLEDVLRPRAHHRAIKWRKGSRSRSRCRPQLARRRGIGRFFPNTYNNGQQTTNRTSPECLLVILFRCLARWTEFVGLNPSAGGIQTF